MTSKVRKLLYVFLACMPLVWPWPVTKEETPSNISRWNEKGKELASQGDFPKALEAFNKALEIDPQNCVTWNNKGVTFGLKKDYNRAYEAFSTAIRYGCDNDAAIWCNRGLALHNLGRFDEALASYERALIIKPDFTAAWHNKGELFLVQKRCEEALNAYREALMIEPDYPPAKEGVAKAKKCLESS